MLSVDQWIFQLRLDHFEAGGIVGMGDDLHCKRPSVTSCAQRENAIFAINPRERGRPLTGSFIHLPYKEETEEKSRSRAILKIIRESRPFEIIATLASEIVRGGHCEIASLF